MPELPEVEVVRRGLDRWVSGRTVSGVDVMHARAVRRHDGDLADDLIGASVRCVSRRGKYLWMPLEWTGAALVAHLGMSGQLLMQPQKAPDEAHLRVRLRFADGGPQLRFVDQRTFGALMVAPLTGDDAGGHVPDIVSHIARDPFDPDFDETAFEVRVRARDTEIKRALLDQSLVSGIGNIYADESLWRAGLHGRRRTGSLGEAGVRELLGHVRAVMTEALAQGGTSFDSLYVNVNGESGYFDRSLDAYGQEGEPCSRCGTTIARERFMNRSSAFCPRCQPIS
jgi:formamidopyrimidine-DNA glycosylase